MMTYNFPIASANLSLPSFLFDPIIVDPNWRLRGGSRTTHVLSLGDAVHVDLDLGHGQDIGGSGHVDEELCTHWTLARRPN